jgi:hypothetical protein
VRAVMVLLMAFTDRVGLASRWLPR